jgi:glycosyltransferase involved in cell wall biosynthesis
MKIAILTPGGVDRSGTERVIPHLLWQIERLTRAGDEVHVFAFNQEPLPGHWPLLGATIHNAGRRPQLLTLLKMLFAEHRRGRFDILHAFWALPSGFAGAIATHLLRVPLLLTLPGGDLANHPSIGYGGAIRLRSRLKVRFAAASAAAVTAPSAAMCEQASAAGIQAACIPHGVALDRWPQRAPMRRDKRAPLKLLHIGSLNLVKDQATMLRAMARLRDLGQAFELDVIGGDTLGGAVQRCAAELGLADHVRFRGFMPHAGLRQWIERADMLLVSSVHEGGPLVVLEAGIAGVPTIGTSVGHIADFAPDAAIAVPVGDSDAMAEAIHRLAADEEERLRLAYAAQRRAIGKDADATSGGFRRLYAALAERRRATIPARGAGAGVLSQTRGGANV